MVKRNVVLKNPTGLHLRPAGILCKEAMRFTCRTDFEYGNTTANMKSILSVLGACVKSGEELTLVCSGPDEEEALEHLITVIEEGLGE